jgi:serine phosphatase RsbU (regulator of sigma subunit)
LTKSLFFSWKDLKTKLDFKKTMDPKILENEVPNLEARLRKLEPRGSEIPQIHGFDIYGKTIPLHGIGGGDHIIWMDFNKRYDLKERIKEASSARVREKLKLNKSRGGILIADIEGHEVTDAFIASQLHQAFLTGALYELDRSGEITTHLFENLNTRFYSTSTIGGRNKSFTMLYGEISQEGIFRYISAAHPMPLVFSEKENKLIDLSETQMKTSIPIGYMPSKRNVDARKNHSSLGFKEEYEVNELKLENKGDMCILYTDGLEEHFSDFRGTLETTLRDAKDLTSKGIFYRVKKVIDDKITEDKERPKDDISYVVIKKNR